MRAHPATALLLAIAAGCGGGAGDDGPDADPAAPDGPPGSGRERVGLIDIFEDRSMYDDGVNPPFESIWAWWTARFVAAREPRFHQQTMAIGACTLREYTPASCEPACVDGFCVAPDVCEAWPAYVGAGELTITGLAVPQVVDPGGAPYYTPAGQLPGDLFADTAAITVELAGDEIPALSLATTGVPGIVPQIDTKIVLVDGQDQTITWTPAGTGSIRVTINSTNAGHGAPLFAIIECEAPEAAGQVVIPAAMIEAFPPSTAVAICAGHDCPLSTIRRYRRATAPVGSDREVELLVSSQYSFGVDH
jgi:hypothetical protein